MVQISNNTARSFHAGDSTILIVGGGGRIKYQSVPHGPVGAAIEAGLLTESEALFHPELNIVSNVVGSHEMHVAIGPTIELAPRDTVLLGSDGLFDNLFIEEIIEGIRKGPLDAAMAGLVEQTWQRMSAPSPGEPSKPDDLSIVLYRPKS